MVTNCVMDSESHGMHFKANFIPYHSFEKVNAFTGNEENTGSDMDTNSDDGTPKKVIIRKDTSEMEIEAGASRDKPSTSQVSTNDYNNFMNKFTCHLDVWGDVPHDMDMDKGREVKSWEMNDVIDLFDYDFIN